MQKKYGIRAGFAGVTATGLVTLAKEVVIDLVVLAKEVVKGSRNWFGCILVNSCFTCISVGLPLLTNATKVVKYSKALHSVCAASWRAANNVAELSMIAVDYRVFGEYVPS